MSSNGQSEPREGRSQIRIGWAWLLVPFVLVALQRLQNDLVINEMVYLIGGRRLVDPSFLAQDWTYGTPITASLSIAFQTLTVPLWWLFDDAVSVALVGRVLVWTWLLAGWRAVAMALGLGPLPFAFGMSMYIVATQSLGAREWMLGGVEQKCVAYGFVLFALAALARGRSSRAGVLAGLASCFHLLVGGWSSAALSLAALAIRPEIGWRRYFGFVWRAGLVASPVLAIGLGYLGGGDGGATDTNLVREILVRFRNPHHLDPTWFLKPPRLLALPFVFGGALLAVSELSSGTARKLAMALLWALLGIYALGVLAGVSGFYTLTMFYPFRVPDTLIPALFWLCVPTLCWRSLAGREPGPAPSPRRRATALALVIVIISLTVGRIDNSFRHMQRNFASWTQPGAGAPEWRGAWRWIAQQSPADAIFAAPPCEPRFSLFAERAMVVVFKSAPSNTKIIEWRERLSALNAGVPFEKRGKYLCDELARNFPTLDVGALVALRQRYGATHYLMDLADVRGGRPELEAALVHREGTKAIYQLDRLSP